MDLITAPEPNPFAKENDHHHLLLTKLLVRWSSASSQKIGWQILSPAQQFSGFLFFAIIQPGITQIDKLNQLGYLALIRKIFAQRKQFGATPY